MAFIAVLFYKTEFVNLCFSSAKEGESGQVSITDPFLFLLSSLGLVCVLRSRNFLIYYLPSTIMSKIAQAASETQVTENMTAPSMGELQNLQAMYKIEWSELFEVVSDRSDIFERKKKVVSSPKYWTQTGRSQI